AVLSRWFRHKQLSIVVGLMLSMARLTKFVAKLTCYPLVDAAGTFNRPITVAVIFCAISILANVFYWIAMWKAGYATLSGRELSKPSSSYGIKIRDVTGTDDRSRLPFRFSYSVLLYLPGLFWMVPWLQLTMSSVLSSFEDVATEYVQFRFTTSSVMAGIQSSLTQAVPIIAAPLLGLYVHRFGKTLSILIGGTLFLVLSMALLGYTWAPPAVGMILYSFALSFGSVALLSSASLLLPVELAGLGVGIHKCANNIGTTIVSVIVGYVQDLTYHDGNPNDNTTDLRYEYNGVIILYLSLSCFACLLAFLFWFLDRHTLDGWLQVNRKEREDRLILAGQESRKEKKEEYSSERALQLVGSQLLTKPSYVYVGFFSFWLIVSWVLFFTFALMPVYQSYSL
ncbi:MFS general substrate transporter, partial [Backusella circina FSU 941]